MAYDVELADRIREILTEEPEVTEKKMFGSLAFMVRNYMTVVTSGQGGLMVRTNPAKAIEVLASTTATPAVMRGREMKGWFRVAAEEVATDDELEPWVELALAYNATLPAK